MRYGTRTKHEHHAKRPNGQNIGIGRDNCKFQCQIRIPRPKITPKQHAPFLVWRFPPPSYCHSQGDSHLRLSGACLEIGFIGVIWI